jgi:hypothetical protein
MLIARSWWRELVGGKFGGARWSIGGRGFWGLREIPLGWSAPMRWRPWEPPFLLEGRRVYPFPMPLRVSGETLGPIPEATLLLSHPFVKVLLGMRCSGVLRAWWEFSEGRSGCGSSSFLSTRHCCHYFFFLFFSLFSFFGDRLCCDPNKRFVSCGCYINIAGRKPVLWRPILEQR